MTFLEKAKLESKEKRIKFSEDGLPRGCPYKYGYEEEHSCSDVECIECWNREMPNTEPKPKADMDREDYRNLGYNQGLNDAWELEKKLWYLGNQKCKEIFGYEFSIDIIEHFTPQEALTKMKAYEEAQIEVGDVVEGQMSGKKAIVTRADGLYLDVITNEGGIGCWDKEVCKKTGKHLDISSILEQIGE